MRARSLESSSSKSIRGTADVLMLNVEQRASKRTFADISMIRRISYTIRRTTTRESEMAVTKKKRRTNLLVVLSDVRDPLVDLSSASLVA